MCAGKTIKHRPSRVLYWLMRNLFTEQTRRLDDLRPHPVNHPALIDPQKPRVLYSPADRGSKTENFWVRMLRKVTERKQVA